MITITNQRITRAGQLGLNYSPEDGLGLCTKDEFYDVSNCVVDMTNVGCDEAVSITWGAAAMFRNCIFRGASKLVLCGSGDEDMRNTEAKRRVIFQHCLFENFGRRGPEVQSSMVVILDSCVIKNWAIDDKFSVRGFGAWAHHGGLIIANNCTFWQDSFPRSGTHMLADLANHIGQHVNDGGFFSLFKFKTYLPGVCRGLIASDGGTVETSLCCKNKWWIYTDDTVPLDEQFAKAHLDTFKSML